MNLRYRIIAIMALIVSTVLSEPGFAQVRVTNARIDAEKRLSRGIALMKQDDYDAALSEFLQVHDATSNPAAQLNIGLTYTSLKRPVEAVKWLEKWLLNPPALTKEKKKHVETILEEQKALVGTIIVTANVPHADVAIEKLGSFKLPPIDATAPTSSPIPLASGTHLVTVSAPGYAPKRQVVTIAGERQTSVHFELEILQGRIAHLNISTQLPGVEVFIDGKLSGETPLSEPLELVQGNYLVELKRPGYFDYPKTVKLREADDETINVELKENPEWIAAHGGSLALRFSETLPTMITVDGGSRGEYQVPLRLAPGVHHVIAERNGFFPAERHILIAPPQATSIFIQFKPTLVRLEEYEFRRKWSVRTIIGGAVLTGVSTLAGSLFFYEYKQFDTIKLGRNDVSSRKTALTLATLGGVGGGIGLASLVTGIVLFAGNPDPRSEASEPSKQASALPSVIPMVWPSQHGAMVGMVGNF